jgi:hypothetical protein
MQLMTENQVTFLKGQTVKDLQKIPVVTIDANFSYEQRKKRNQQAFILIEIPVSGKIKLKEIR